MGETSMGLQGKKYLELSNGEKKATPIPPSVMPSSSPCDTVHIVKKKKYFNPDTLKKSLR